MGLDGISFNGAPTIRLVMDYLTQTLWRYDGDDVIAVGYSRFNVVEAVAWFAIAIYVTRRYLIHRRSLVELFYGLTFLLFGISDLWEARIVQPWLILAKGLIFFHSWRRGCIWFGDITWDGRFDLHGRSAFSGLSVAAGERLRR